MSWQSFWSGVRNGWNNIWNAPYTEADISRLLSFNVLSDPEKDKQLLDMVNEHNSMTPGAPIVESPTFTSPAVNQSFSSFSPIASYISAGASAVNAINGFGETLGLWKSPQTRIAEKNFKLQQEQYEYQKELQKQLFAREDNAVQRRAQDLQKVGLSKNLAAGSGAQAGAVVKTSAPQFNDMPSDLSRAQKMSMALDNLQSALSLEHLDLQNQLLNEQVKGERIANKVANMDYDWYGADKVLGYIFDAIGSGTSIYNARSGRMNVGINRYNADTNRYNSQSNRIRANAYRQSVNNKYWYGY